MVEPSKWKLRGKWVRSGAEVGAPSQWSHQPTPCSRSIFVVNDGALDHRQRVSSYDGSPITSDTQIHPGVKGMLGKEEISFGDLFFGFPQGGIAEVRHILEAAAPLGARGFQEWHLAVVPFWD